MTQSRSRPYAAGAPIGDYAPATKIFDSTLSSNTLFDSCQLGYSRSTGLPYIWTPSAGWQVIQASGSSGILPVSGGGTGVGTLTGIPLFAGTSPVTALTYVPPTAWVPNLQINGSDTGITYTTQVGSWSQMGSWVFISGNILLSSKGASVGTVTLSNLPVATGASGTINNMPINFSVVTLDANYTSIYGDFDNSSAVVTFVQQGTAGVTASVVTNAMIADTSLFQFSGVYLIN